MSWFKKKTLSQAREETGAAPDSPTGSGIFGRLKKGLAKTRDLLNTDIEDIFRGRKSIDDDVLEEIEERLITADMGVETTTALMDRVRKHSGAIRTASDLKTILKTELIDMMKTPPVLEMVETPWVVMIVGVNGVGKTTTIGKLAARYGKDGKSVLIAAADTFRAAAVEQLEIWADRAGAEIVRHRENADPAAVAFDGVEAAMARGKDVVIIDTAGRLHTKINLMEELKKIKRAIAKKMSSAPHETLLVLDATTGQNALSQARLFHDALTVTGLALTKLDGTAKGGVAVSISQQLEIPIQYIGVGEQLDDLQPFRPEQYVAALFGDA